MKMSMLLKRRQVLHWALAGGLSLALIPSLSRKSYAASSALSWLELDQDLALIQGAGGNVLASRGADGIMLVDGAGLGQGEEVLRLVEQHWNARPALLFNTHCHRDQLGCNAILG